MDEVCKLTDIRPYILRFWESEFDEINPLTSASGQRLYEHKDIMSILNIKNLLVNQKLSIEKAKKSFKKNKKEMHEKSKSHDKGYRSQNLEENLVLIKERLQSIVSEAQSLENFLNKL